MSTESDRDTSVDRLLRAELGRAGEGGLPPTTPSCVDAETLAAWSGAALSSEEARVVESHVADCARCQAMMAIFARTEPVPAAVIPFRSRWSMRWLVPLAAGTLAATLLIWTAWPTTTPAPAPAQTMARSEAREATPPAAAATASTPASSLADRGSQQSARADVAQSELKARVLPPSLPTTAPTRVPAQPIPLSAPTTPPPAAEPPAIPPRAAAAAGQRPQGQAAGAAGNIAPTFRSAVPAAAAAIVAEFAASDLLPPVVAGGADAAAGRAGGGGAGGRGGGGGAGAVGARAVNGNLRFDPPLRWRVQASGVVERSLTAGASWEPVTIDPPDVKITSGVAPTPLVCWLVGRAGVVLLAVDGVHFTRVIFPEPVDLASIRATSARDATVTTVDGRVFVTTDGGVTWKGSNLVFQHRDHWSGRIGEMTTAVVTMLKYKI